MFRSCVPVLLGVVIAGCAGLIPTAAPVVPDRVAEYLASDGVTLGTAARADDARDLPPIAVLTKVRELDDIDGFRGPPDAPTYGSLTCSAACPSWIGDRDPVAAWLVWFPDAEAFVIVDARTGQMLRAAVTIRGSGEWSTVL